MKKIITRLSFNINDWQGVSGSIGKSRNQIHEHIYGFGFEEWLFNDSATMVDEKGVKWHYGYIEGIHKNYKPSDELCCLQLFTIDARNRNRYLVAEIFEWEKIDQNQSQDFAQNNQEFVDGIRVELTSLPGNYSLIAPRKFEQQKAGDSSELLQLFNVRFKSYSYLFDKQNPIPTPNRIYNLNRFWLYR